MPYRTLILDITIYGFLRNIFMFYNGFSTNKAVTAWNIKNKAVTVETVVWLTVTRSRENMQTGRLCGRWWCGRSRHRIRCSQQISLLQEDPWTWRIGLTDSYSTSSRTAESLPFSFFYFYFFFIWVDVLYNNKLHFQSPKTTSSTVIHRTAHCRTTLA